MPFLTEQHLQIQAWLWELPCLGCSQGLLTPLCGGKHLSRLKEWREGGVGVKGGCARFTELEGALVNLGSLSFHSRETEARESP